MDRTESARLAADVARPRAWRPAGRALLLLGLVAVLGGSGGGARDLGSNDGGDSTGADAGTEAGGLAEILALDHVGIGAYGTTGWTSIGGTSAEVDWHDGPFASVRLVVDLESACFPFSKWSNDPPPAGQQWPARCDAFDRNFNVLIDDTSADTADPGAGSGDGTPNLDGGADGAMFATAVPASRSRTPFEVIHAVTPFGGPEHLEADLTDLANGLPGKHRLRVELEAYPDPQGKVTGSNAGWTVTARIDVTPGAAPRHVLAAVPLYRTRLGPGQPFPTAGWDVPDGATGGRIEYRASGHGQGTVAPRCVGPAEEFCDRTHQLFIDGAMVDNIDLFREDCQTLCTLAHQGPAGAGFDYCVENPCGDVGSAQAPRANWCPGTMTAPYVWEDLAAFTTPGTHTLAVQILNIATGGTWLGSATYFAYGP